MKQLIISADSRETRVAVMEQARLAELYIERRDSLSIVGNIYKGRVENVLAGMEAAFVDIGLERNGFLFVDDVVLADDANARPKRITQMLKAGQEIVVQVTKDPMGTKGPRLTTELSIAGRSLVYVPRGSLCGVSRRLPDEERLRLRHLCREIRPENAGLIVRTAAEGVSEKAITRDLRYLEKLWETIDKRLTSAPGPSLVYSEAELALRVVRDLLNEGFSQILVDEDALARKIVSFLQSTTPELADRVQVYRGSRPLFETYGLDAETRKALERRVDLASGGYLVIDYTEALTVIDVNSGRYVGRKYLEDAIVKTNLEACREVVRQLRIRDIGGIIIIDFIDMAQKENRQQVLSALETELAKDRTKTYVVELSPLGLVEMTRQNVTEGVRGVLTSICPTCNGEGVLLTPESQAIGVERRLRRLAESSASEAFLLEVHPRVAAVLLRNGAARLHDIQTQTGKYLSIEGVWHVPPDEFRIGAEGGRDVIERASLPVVGGQELEVLVVERHAYNSHDGVAHVNGYPICVAGGAALIGSRTRVVIDEATRSCANAHLALKGSAGRRLA